MTKFIFFFSLFIITTTSCGNNKKENKNAENISSKIGIEDSEASSEWKIDSLSIENTTKEGTTIYLSINYPTSGSKNAKLEKIQQTIAKILSVENDGMLSLQFIFDRKLEEMTDYAIYEEKQRLGVKKGMDFLIGLNYKIEKISEDLLRTALDSYGFLGGAHGFGDLRYYNIDARSGEVLSDEGLFTSENKAKIATLLQKVIEKRNASENEEEHIDLLVDISDVCPNDNFYWGDNGFSYIYNQYEYRA